MLKTISQNLNIYLRILFYLKTDPISRFKILTLTPWNWIRNKAGFSKPLLIKIKLIIANREAYCYLIPSLSSEVLVVNKIFVNHVFKSFKRLDMIHYIVGEVHMDLMGGSKEEFLDLMKPYFNINIQEDNPVWIVMEDRPQN